MTFFSESGTIDFNEFLTIVMMYWKDPVDEEKELREAFQVFDRNGDGYVVAEEIKYVMANLGQNLTDSEVLDIIKKADVDGDGRLNYEGEEYYNYYLLYRALMLLQCRSHRLIWNYKIILIILDTPLLKPSFYHFSLWRYLAP